MIQFNLEPKTVKVQYEGTYTIDNRKYNFILIHDWTETPYDKDLVVFWDKEFPTIDLNEVEFNIKKEFRKTLNTIRNGKDL